MKTLLTTAALVFAASTASADRTPMATITMQQIDKRHHQKQNTSRDDQRKH